MQTYITPAPGRSPAHSMITDREDYKLEVIVKEFKPNQFQLILRRYVIETGWTKTELFLTADELELLKQSLQPHKTR